MENPINMDDLGGTTIFGNIHMIIEYHNICCMHPCVWKAHKKKSILKTGGIPWEGVNWEPYIFSEKIRGNHWETPENIGDLTLDTMPNSLEWASHELQSQNQYGLVNHNPQLVEHWGNALTVLSWSLLQRKHRHKQLCNHCVVGTSSLNSWIVWKIDSQWWSLPGDRKAWPWNSSSRIRLFAFGSWVLYPSSFLKKVSKPQRNTEGWQNLLNPACEESPKDRLFRLQHLLCPSLH